MDRVRGGLAVTEISPDIEQMVLTEDDIQTKVGLMGKQISEDYRNDDLLLVGVRTLLTNWRLTLIQILPAVWIWIAMYDLKAHALHGKSFDVLRGPVLIPINLAIIAITAAAFALNAVFAFAIASPPRQTISPAATRMMIRIERSSALRVTLHGF